MHHFLEDRGEVNMFEILYRITDKTDELITLDENFDGGGDIEGFFAINVNGNFYGHYHGNPLKEGEEGWDLLTGWFARLILAYQKLCDSDYVAVNNIESYNSWIEFKRKQEWIIVSIVEVEKPSGTMEVELIPLKKIVYGEWHSESIKLTEFHDELVNKASMYLDEIHEINAKLLSNKYIAEVNMWVSQNQKNENN